MSFSWIVCESSDLCPYKGKEREAGTWDYSYPEPGGTPQQVLPPSLRKEPTLAMPSF